MGIPLGDMVGWDPYMLIGGNTPERLRQAKVILWKGHCSVHQRFLPEHIERVRAKYEGIRVIVHPECRWEVCQKSDAIGSTDRLIKIISDAPRGTKFAVGTEIHLVNRMAKDFATDDKLVITLDDAGCLCTTMFRISPQHLCWALENLVEGNVVNRITVPADVKHWARVALPRAEREKTAQRIKDAIEEMSAASVQVKELDMGLLDFPCMVGGRLILLCWKMGEKAIEHWHSTEEGFAGRKPIDERIAKAKGREE